MIRRHFLSSTVNNNCVITYTTLNGDIFDMEAIQKSYQQLVQSMVGSEIPILPEIISNTYTTYGEIRFSNPVTEIGLGSLSVMPPIFSDVPPTVPDSNKQLTTVTLPPSVVKINTSAFEGCSYLTSITIPNSVISIGNEAFSDCDSLTSVVWNAENCADFSSTSSGPFASINYQITSFTFGDSVKHIPAYLCFNMYNLTSIIIPSSVTSIGDSAFSGCNRLASITYTGTTSQWNTITKDNGWNELTSATVVHCTDGDITI